MKKFDFIFLIILLLVVLLQFASAYTCMGSIDKNSHPCLTTYPTIAGSYQKTLTSICRITPLAGELVKCSYMCNLGFYYSAGTYPIASSCIPYSCQKGYDIPSETVLCPGADADLTYNMTGSFVSSCSGEQCEYVCQLGYSYSTANRWGSPECIPNVCYETSPPIDPNAVMCPNANSQIPYSMDKYLTPECDTETRKCSWECKLGYYRVFLNNSFSCKPYICTGNIAANSEIYSFDATELTKDTSVTLVDANTSNKCESHCKDGFYKDGNFCLPLVCGGEVDPNSVIYSGDNIGIIPKSDLINKLVEADSNRKCEYHCKSGFYKLNDNCLPYLCNGEIDSNAVVCENDDIGLDNFYTKSLLSSGSECSFSRKCEYYCREGFYEKEGVCLPFSTLVCDGNTFSNATLCANDDVFLTAKGLTNILISSNGNCSERKCEWYCKKGYYKGTGLDINKCLPYLCDGNIDSNTMIYFKDDFDLNALTFKKLVDLNTIAKCEYYCRNGFHKGSGVDVNKCVMNTYFCLGDFDNATLYSNDGVGLDQNIASVLSKINTDRKCEWGCNEGYIKINNECVSTVKEEGVCGNANKSYLIGESFPGSYLLCEKGVASIDSPTLDSIIGSSVSWKCVSDINSNCKATRSPSPIGEEFNSILELFTDVSEDNNILVSIKCSTNVKVNLSVTSSLGEDYNLSENQIDCNNSITTHKINLLDPLLEETELVVKTSIKDTASNCYTCEKDSALDVSNTGLVENSIGNPFLIVGIIGVVLIFAIVLNVLFNQSDEEVVEK